jgi:hypothetical protein
MPETGTVLILMPHQGKQDDDGNGNTEKPE